MNRDEIEVEVRLRRALARQAQEVQPPADGLQRIRAAIAAEGTPATPRRLRPRLWLPLTAAAAAAVLAFAVITPSVLRSRRAAPAQVAQSAPAAGVVQPLPVYFVTEQQGRWALVREFEPTSLTQPGQRLEAALRRAVSGRANDRDYTSVWRYEHLTAEPPEALAGAVTAVQTPTSINVTLAPGLLGTSADDAALARLAVQQIVWTATATVQQLVPVQISSPVAQARLFGTLPLSDAFDRSLALGEPRAPVWISSLVDGQALPVGTATVTGDAAAGAPVRWTLRRLDGDQEREVASGLTTPVPDGTAAAAGGRAVWRAEVPLSRPGRYLFEVSIGLWNDTKEVQAVG